MMILQRISKGMKNQDWFTVVVEIFIVVIGIYIGLQVDGWNQDRKDRIEEKVYLERLKDDLTQSISFFDKDIVRGQKAVVDQDYVIATLAKGTLPDEEKENFGVKLNSVSVLIQFRIIRNTMDELQATGNLTLLQSTALRQRLSQFDEYLDIEMVKAQDAKDPTLNMFTEITRYFTYTRVGPEADAKIVYNFQYLVDNPIVHNRFVVLNGSTRGNLARLIRVKTASEEMLRQLGQN